MHCGEVDVNEDWINDFFAILRSKDQQLLNNIESCVAIKENYIKNVHGFFTV
jgi:hypothetical protein